MEISKIHQKFLSCTAGVTIDSRKVSNGSFFVAIKGDNFDAHHFIKEVFEKGAFFVVIDNPEYAHFQNTILVKNSIETLQQLASFHRDYMKTTIVSLTGSNGKTTCKELIHVVLSTQFKTLATLGNLNNHLGVPLTLLSIKKEHEIAIVEMGANHQKEIEFLCQIAKPDFGLITNFGKAHLEGFGGVEGVVKGKSEMYDYLRNHHKTAFVNVNDPIQVEKSKDIHSYTFGFDTFDSDVNFEKVEGENFASISYKNQRICSNLMGQYNANNLMLAVTIGLFFEVDFSQIKNAIESYFPTNNRSQTMEVFSNQVIMDAYNANPSSMEVAIRNLISMDVDKKVFILGDMFELGNESASEHQSIVNLLQDEVQTEVYLIGQYFNDCSHTTSHIKQFKSFDDFVMYWKQNPVFNSTILIKGSRGMALERTLDYLKP
jgi:UDP-N-acetylmuramoyl-tripeptide--D-alanyl-D-alanine ligase